MPWDFEHADPTRCTTQATEVIFNKIASNPSDVNWKVQGQARVESAITLQEKQFSDEL